MMRHPAAGGPEGLGTHAEGRLSRLCVLTGGAGDASRAIPRAGVPSGRAERAVLAGAR
ncbi:hypothetical protein Tbis_2450 [Thermobispora bispora DSM 43833]|uniref:Uncharacterized protein n=1 Tax=Thermobispora bispora (strain ATCC 19993 / DSM 43833 / CBS 139.67 / JCM 10125 / KCTC 9307 / NBRC 14880 / R51) TaxID=469371 RepID=D6Y4H7_THEBD|nr:hypothetical protein Tbis_2450 [Thermobispora bispora DSM 43833]